MVWVFNAGGWFAPCGIFDSLEEMEEYVRGHKLSGVGSQYPVGIGLYEYAVETGRFRPTKPHHGSASQVGRFAPPKHFHYEDGERSG